MSHRHGVPKPTIHAASHVDHGKIIAWISISMLAGASVPIVMGLRLAATAPLFRSIYL